MVNSTTDEAVAMKIIDLRKHSGAALLVRKETAIQRSLRHPNLLQYYGKRSHGHYEYIFLEYCSGGELFDRIGEPLRISTIVHALDSLYFFLSHTIKNKTCLHGCIVLL